MVFEQPRRRRNALPLVIAVIVGLVAIVGVYTVLKKGKSTGGGSGQSAVHRPGCTPLRLAASAEKAALLGQIASGYNGSTRSYGGGKCADVTVVSVASGTAMLALASGWDAQRDGGPAPQVWSPASSAWVALLRQQAVVNDKAIALPDGKPPSIVQTPLVLAMPKPMAQALGWPDKPIGWTDVLSLTRNPQGWGAVGHPEWGRFRLGKTNPHISTAGLSATIGAYFAATGRSSDLTEADLANPKVLDFVKGVESGVVHYGDTTLTFLANQLEADARGQGLSYVGAVTVEEKSLFDYNTGNPSGDPKTAGKGRKPQVPLVAVYPKEGTLLSDSPYVELGGMTDEQKAGAEDFLAYLHEPAQQKRFTDAGFRTFEGRPGAAVTAANGMLPDAKYTVINPPPAPVTAKALSTWDTQRKRARALLVLDVSGSMAELTAGGPSKLDLAKRAAKQAIDMFAADDQVGLWTFSTEQTAGGTPYTARVPIGPVAQVGGQLRSTIDGLHAEGGTALYASTRAAAQAMLADSDPSRINAVVVLTDGQNEYPRDNDLTRLLRDLDASHLENSVRVFTIAYGDEADLDTLKKIASASRAAAYDARDPTTITKVLTNVISNF
ncbi:MAG: Ca-activated chloride channel [Micromonosporaceae bacterium]